MAKRDFIFMDESGEPGEETPYYIQGLLHITDESLKEINIHLGALRYFGDLKSELKSTRLKQVQKDKLLDILKCSLADGAGFASASAIFIDKSKYDGRYIKDTLTSPKDATRFRHFAMRRLIEFHFQNNKAQSKEIEIVIDRFHSDEAKEQQLKNYLRKLTTLSFVPDFLHIIQADSRYVELLQIADWITGSVKEKYFTHTEREYNDLFKYIKVQQIIN